MPLARLVAPGHFPADTGESLRKPPPSRGHWSVDVWAMSEQQHGKKVGCRGFYILDDTIYCRV